LSRLYITRIDAEYECDVYFPPIGPEWVEEEDERVPPQLQVSTALILSWA
jgi:dihydrofolate reductase